MGLATYKPVLMLSGGGDRLLDPTPRVMSIDPERLGNWLTSNVQLLGDELILSGVSRAYTADELKRAEYVIEPGTSRARRCQFLYLYDNKDLTWAVVVNPYEGATV
jgi:hypothetical protein